MKVGRRDFLTGALRPRNLALACTGAVVWSHGVDEARGAAFSLRPPGAREETDFLAACIKCGQCVEACPFDTLALAEAGDEAAIGVPRFDAREEPCHMCEDVPCIVSCPTDALEKDVAIEDAEMGLAVLSDQETCLAFQGLRCEVCYRACPMIGKAITLEFRPQERTGKHAFFLPVVNSEHCTGCGMCEHSCILEEAAIRVLPKDLTKGKLGEHYRFGWKEEAHISRDFTAPESAPDVFDSEANMNKVLQEMEDWSGIEDP
ncbi:MAG: ferredoxin-type protein NapG [Myxococcota bacterium]|nr:ferredoxin-type protein NapG [Myxococcota bacterium]